MASRISTLRSISKSSKCIPRTPGFVQNISTVQMPVERKTSHTQPKALKSTQPLPSFRVPSGSPHYIKDLKFHDLTCFTVLSAATSPTLLKTSIAAFPYVPNWLIKAFVYPVYVGGENCAQVVATGNKLLQRGFANMMISYSVEDAEGGAVDSEKERLLNGAVGTIKESISDVLVAHYEYAEKSYQDGNSSVVPASGYVALKPTGLMRNAADLLANHDNPAYKDQWEAYLAICRDICQYAKDHGNGRAVVTFDAEKYHLQPGVYAAQRAMMKEFNRDGQIVVMGTVQMYLADSMKTLKQEYEMAKDGGYQLALKLVRGAYIHTEPDRKVIHATKADSDASYNEGVKFMLDDILNNDAASRTVGRVFVASHNQESMRMVDDALQANPLPKHDESVVFGQLLGMADDAGSLLAKRGHKVIKYVPFGPTQEMKDYLARRLEENGDSVNEGGAKMVKYGLSEMLSRAF